MWQIKNMVTDPSPFDAALLCVSLNILLKGVILLADNVTMCLLLLMCFLNSWYLASK